jgi:hypothetical protein
VKARAVRVTGGWMTKSVQVVEAVVGIEPSIVQ